MLMQLIMVCTLQQLQHLIQHQQTVHIKSNAAALKCTKTATGGSTKIMTANKVFTSAPRRMPYSYLWFLTV